MTRKTKAVAATPKKPTQDDCKRAAKLALSPSINAAAVTEAYQGNIVGKDVDFQTLVDGLRQSCDTAKDGDLSNLEAMLIGQATALQSIFVSLARRAQVQEYQRNLESFLTLGLKAQAQSRATIQALVELKYPRQVAFVKQANISNGPQQVNNGVTFETSTRARGRKSNREKQTIRGWNQWPHVPGHRSNERGRRRRSGVGSHGSSPPGRQAPKVKPRLRAMPIPEASG